MTTLARIADAVLNRPLLLSTDKLALVASVLEGRIGIDASGLVEAAAEGAGTPSPSASRFISSRVDRERGAALPYMRTTDGVAVIPLSGSFVNRGAWIGASSGLISFEGFRHQLREAGADPQVRAVLLDMETPGGQALGAFEAAKAVRDVAAEKPVTAVVNGLAASAGYAIASGATRIITTPSGISGSIGVVMLHLDHSGALDKKGVRPTLIHAGARKVDGHPYGPLSADVRDDLQAEVDGILTAFVATVRAGRPGLSEKAIRATEARTYTGPDAVAAGLADAIGSFEEALADAPRAGARRSPSPSAGVRASTTRKAEMDEAEIRADERGRIRAIVGSEEAKDRQPQALAVALDTSLSLEEARAILRASPKASSALSLDSRMAGRTELTLDPDKAPSADRDAKAAERAKALDPTRIYEARRASNAAVRDAGGAGR